MITSRSAADSKKKKAEKKKPAKKEQAVKPVVPAFLKPDAKKAEHKQKSSKRPRNKGRS